MASGGRSINAGSADGETRPISMYFGSDEVGTESINLGSDQVFQNNCNVCLTQGNTREAVSYCTICNEYLCQGCEYSHKGSRFSKDHTLLTGSSIPSGSTKKKQTLPIMLCDTHKTSLLEIYCKTHDEVICSICKMSSHTECDTVDVSRHASKSNVAGTFRTVVKSLVDTEDKFVNLQKSRQLDKTSLKTKIQTCLQDMRQIRHDVNVKFDEFEKDMAAEIKKLEDKLSKEIDDHEALSKNILNQISDLKESLDECHKARDDDVMFIGTKKASSRKIEFEKIIGSIMAEVYPIDIRIEPNEILTDVIDQTLGTLVTGEQSRPSRSVPTADSNLTGRNTRARPSRSVVTADSNSTSPSRSVQSLLTMTVGHKQEEINLSSIYVGGCTFMPDGHLVVTCGGFGLKLFDRSLKYISELSAPSKDVVCINDTEVIVTQGVYNQLQRVQVLPTMKVKSTMKMGKKCLGVDVFDNLIYTGCTDGSSNGEIRVLDMDGNTQRRLGVENKIFMFQRPQRVRVSKNGSKLFVSDSATHIVTCLNQQGHVIYQYSNKELKKPYGLYVDREDNLLVCGKDSRNIHVVRHDGKQEKILLSKKDGILSTMDISYRQSDGCLAVVMCGWIGTKCIVFKTNI